jgi:magnesium-transporting ATPase (P-type)
MDKHTGKYVASSPDELALITAAKQFGVEFVERDEQNCYVVNVLGEQQKYKVLNVLEFSSSRKRMSIVL